MIWVNIGRGATLRLVRRRLYPVVADSRSSECDEMFLRSQKLAEQCAESATIIIDYIDFHTCSSAVIVLLLNALLRTPCHQLLPVTRGIEALRFMANGSLLAMNGLRLVERLQEAVYKTIGVTGRGGLLDQQPPSLQPTGQNFSQRGTLNIAGDLPYITAANDTACDVPPLILPLLV
ncbi:C6 transcription factor [Penicillium chrysogenum]|uniref:C6 transcription factor n=1 Tax=Penicillium chrysogenum TaxID=5076 RepID=A0ABQ8W9V9_PENCH|nr:C6 transcription factor [Penicillium chrysogenum]KAJ6159532.1 C6 transcription factor [Penicillium chrysogenum]